MTNFATDQTAPSEASILLASKCQLRLNDSVSLNLFMRVTGKFNNFHSPSTNVSGSLLSVRVERKAKVRNRYNQVPYLTVNTNIPEGPENGKNINITCISICGNKFYQPHATQQLSAVTYK